MQYCSYSDMKNPKKKGNLKNPKTLHSALKRCFMTSHVIYSFLLSMYVANFLYLFTSSFPINPNSHL